MPNNNIIWRPISGYEGLYEVSNCGRIRSIDRMVQFWDRHNNLFIERLRKGTKLKPSTTPNGYKLVTLHKNGVRSQFLVHRLVLSTFCGPCANLFVNHKDGNRINNNINNLEWVTHSENVRHGINLKKQMQNDKK